MTDEAATAFPSLTTARLSLRALADRDAAAFHAIHADAEAMRYWSEPAWTDPGRARDVMQRDREALADGSSYRFGLFDAVDGLVGCCSLHRVDTVQRRGEVGYILRRSHWGRGLMREALSAMVDFAFRTLALRRLEADIDPRNAASARVVVRLGFVFEAWMRARWQVAGEISDSAIFGLLRDDWRAADSRGRQFDENCSATVPSDL
jgi:RimJ/RimL family protein N-acetyltransferase